MPGTVCLVDDDASVREALGSLIRSFGYEVRPYASAAEFLAAEPPTGLACLVLDVHMPGMGGLELQSALTGTAHGMPVIFISGRGDVPVVVKAMKAGSVDFLTKPLSDAALLSAIGAALEQHDQVRQREAASHDIRVRYAKLTPRETEVAAQVMRGMLNKQIAMDLGVSEITVKVHRHNVMRKMGAKSIPELVLMLNEIGAPFGSGAHGGGGK